MTKNSNTTKDFKQKTIAKRITFPDASSFPIHSIFDVYEGQTQVCYIDQDLPQILWVPNDFITND